MDTDTEFYADIEVLQALAASEGPFPPQIQQRNPEGLVDQVPTPRISSNITSEYPANGPTPSSSLSAAGRIVQPTPQSRPNFPASGSAIQVSTRQKGNPVLACIKNLSWEYSDIPADYVLGRTTCALFLSLKYHRLHPEYMYTRIQNLKGKYSLRIVLAVVDIPNHEDPLRELTKTALVNDFTMILCWSAQEAARYLELYKSLEHAGPSCIKGRPPATYSERVVEFVTVPRGINKVDAITLVSGFGTLRKAINTDLDAIVGIPGWGQHKIQKWCNAIEAPLRARKATKHYAPGPAQLPNRAAEVSERTAKCRKP